MGDRLHIRTHGAETCRRVAAPGRWRACAHALVALMALLALMLGPSGGSARAEPVKADVTVDMSKGYARIVLRFTACFGFERLEDRSFNPSLPGQPGPSLRFR